MYSQLASSNYKLRLKTIENTRNINEILLYRTLDQVNPATRFTIDEFTIALFR